MKNLNLSTYLNLEASIFELLFKNKYRILFGIDNTVEFLVYGTLT